MSTIVILVAALALAAAPLPAWVPKTVTPATGFEVAKPAPRRPLPLPPILKLAQVKGRNPRAIREWRDPAQTYAIFWTAKTNAYQVLQIEGDVYRVLPTESDGRKNGGGSNGPRRPNLHLTYEDAANALNQHWRFMTGRQPAPYKASPTLQRALAKAGQSELWKKDLSNEPAAVRITRKK